MDDNNWDSRYVIALFKTVVTSILFLGTIALGYIGYVYMIDGPIYTAIDNLKGPIFYFNAIIIFLVFGSYFLYRAKTEF